MRRPLNDHCHHCHHCHHFANSLLLSSPSSSLPMDQLDITSAPTYSVSTQHAHADTSVQNRPVEHMHPLEIQEIADTVASYLDGRDLARCVRVSKHWHDIFLLHIWRVVYMVPIYIKALGRRVRRRPDRDNFYNYRHLIQDLSVDEQISELDKYDYPSLRRFAVAMKILTSGVKEISMDLTKLAPVLVELKMSNVETQPAFWETLSEHPHLRIMTLLNMRVETHATPGFWRTCMNLESLEMRQFHIQVGGRPRNLLFDRIRKLTMDYHGGQDNSYQMDLVLQSPMLESLDWSTRSLTTLKEQSEHRHLSPHLRRLRIICADHQDEDLAYMLEVIGNGHGGLVYFWLGASMGLESSKALRPHFSTLVDLDLRDSIDRSIVADILCSCPRLETLKAGNVPAKDIAERGPWVCQQLRELKIWFEFSTSEQELHPLVFERLSTLTQLKCLEIQYEAPSGEKGLDFRLGRGLERLARLRQLRVLGFYTLSRDQYNGLDVENVTWMVESLKNLKVLLGPLNSDKKEVAPTLKEMLESRGIAITFRGQ